MRRDITLVVALLSVGCAKELSRDEALEQLRRDAMLTRNEVVRLTLAADCDFSERRPVTEQFLDQLQTKGLLQTTITPLPDRDVLMLIMEGEKKVKGRIPDACIEAVRRYASAGNSLLFAMGHKLWVRHIEITPKGTKVGLVTGSHEYTVAKRRIANVTGIQTVDENLRMVEFTVTPEPTEFGEASGLYPLLVTVPSQKLAGTFQRYDDGWRIRSQ